MTFSPRLCVSSAALREWGSPEGRLPPAEEVVQPKRLLQQIHTEEELLHSRLDTRVKNHPAGEQVSFACFCYRLFFVVFTPVVQTIRSEHIIYRH